MAHAQFIGKRISYDSANRELRNLMERKRLIGLIAVIQSVLCLIHLLFYETWIFSPAGRDTHGALWIILVLGFLSVSFVAASLLAFRYTNAALRAFYRVAAVWMGLVSFLFLAAVASWIIFGVARLAGLDMNFHRTVELLLGAAVVAGLYGVYNASWTRITRTTVRLANLPAAWHGRRAALISDVHLGHVRNGSFLRRLVAKILREEPDAIFIAGDLYDGTAIDARRAAEGQFVYGLSQIGRMQVFTSSGAGTWGPPLRLGSNPEIVMLEFQFQQS
jgi:hypothetical protein